MNRRIFLVVFFISSMVMPSQSLAAIKSTIDDQTSVEVTVYNNNLGLIKDTRKFNIPRGISEVRFMDVSAYIQPETVRAKSLNNVNKFMVLEQNYEYDLMDPMKLLNKFVGKNIKLKQENKYQDTTKIIEAKLLSNNNNQPIYEIDGEIYLGSGGIPILPEIPENLIAKPTLMWMVSNKGSENQELEVSYLTSNMNWNADYVLVLDKEDKFGDITGWVTVNNKSGTAYENAALKLVAGEVNVVQQSPRRLFKAMGAMALESSMDQQFQEKGFFEYHIYDLQRPTTLKNNQKKQINLLEASHFNIEKEYLVYGSKTYFNRQYREQNTKQPVNVNIVFKNTKENKLGMPLPKGIVRLYKEDDESKLQFVGSDSIEHTPKDERISLKVGEAFDITVKRTQIDFKQLTTRLQESEWEVVLKNHKDEDVVVSVIEPTYGRWKIVNSSHVYKKVDAFTLRFDIPVPKDETVKLKYRIQIGLR